MTSQQLYQIQAKYKVLGVNNINSSTQLQWLTLSYALCILGTAAVMSFSQNLTAILLYVLAYSPQYTLDIKY